VSLIQLALSAALVAIALVLIMASAWYAQQRSGTTGRIDVTWSRGVGVVAFLAAIWPLGQAWSQWRQIIVSVLVMSWCLRLGLHIAERNRAASDDPRYRNLIIQWGGDAPQRMFWFLQSQAAVGIVLVFSIMLAAQNPNPEFRLQDGIGLAILVGAIAGESIADSQLRAFKAANRNAICDVGLWGWSRHPNYFGEMGFWWGLWLFGLAAEPAWAWWTLAGPVSITLMFRFVSLPMVETRMRERRPDYADYARTTSLVVPWPPRRAAH
jgi:steroid 5-alpha reductase family enzyme